MAKREQLDNDVVKVNVGGRPTSYRPEFVKTAEILARNGATQEEIAECLGVNRSSIVRWSVQHPEFGAAIQAGNDVFNPRVERALAERALGFYADQFTWRATTSQERKEGKPEYVLVPTGRTYYPADVTAAIYWTKNRMKDKWADVQKHEVNGKLKTSDEYLEEFNKKLLTLQEQGYLKGMKVYSLPGDDDGEDKAE